MVARTLERLDAEAPRAAGSLSDRADLEGLNAEAPRAAGSLSDRAGVERLNTEAFFRAFAGGTRT